MKAMKTLSLCAALLTAAVSVPVSPVTAFAEGEEAPSSGKCGEKKPWECAFAELLIYCACDKCRKCKADQEGALVVQAQGRGG